MGGLNEQIQVSIFRHTKLTKLFSTLALWNLDKMATIFTDGIIKAFFVIANNFAALIQVLAKIHFLKVALTHCGLVMPYGCRDLGQHWFRKWLVAWWHQAITWTNVDMSSLRSSDVHLRAISFEISEPSVTKISLKIIFLRFYWNLPGANELIV